SERRHRWLAAWGGVVTEQVRVATAGHAAVRRGASRPAQATKPVDAASAPTLGSSVDAATALSCFQGCGFVFADGCTPGHHRCRSWRSRLNFIMTLLPCRYILPAGFPCTFAIRPNIS